MNLWVILLLATASWGDTLGTGISGVDVRQGKEVSISWKDSTLATVVVFVSAKCPCSASHELALKQLSEEFSPQGVQFIGIHSNADESAEMTRAHFTGSAIPFPILQDQASEWANRFGALKTPHSYVVSPAGEILFQGGVDDSHNAAQAKTPHLKNAILAVKDGKKPNPNRVRALGCSIRRN